MSLIDRITRRREEVQRSDPVTMEEFGYLVGQGTGAQVRTKSGVTITPQRALGVTAWYSGVRYIAETMAGIPCHTYRGAKGQRGQRADPPWKKRPDDEQVWFGAVEFWLMSLLHRGNAYSFKLRNPLGQVTGLRGIHPDRIKPGQAADGTKVFELDGRNDIAFTTREILHIPGLSYDGVIGLNPIQVFAEPLGTAAAADQYAGSFYGSGTHERAYLTVPQTLTVAQATEMKSQWEKMHKGLMHAHEFGVLGGGAEYKTIGLNPEQTQLLQTRHYSVSEISRMLRIPPHKLYDLERATFSNIEQQSIEAVVDGIRPWATRIEAWINDDIDLLPDRNFIEFELDGLMRGDITARYQAFAAGIAGGFLMPAEPRALENLAYVEGSEFLLRPLNMAMVGPDAVELPKPEPSPQKQGAADAPPP